MEPITAVRLEIPTRVLDPYQEEADAKHRPLIDVVTARLNRCRAHRASKPLYFNDEQRAKLEAMLGKCEDADEALKRIAAQATVRAGGVDIQLTDFDLRRLKARMPHLDNFEDHLQWLISKLLQRYLQGEI